MVQDWPESAPDPGAKVIRIGAPLLEPFPPAPGSVAESFLSWAERRSDLLQNIERRIVDRFGVDLAFSSINFPHPEYGLSARVVDLVLNAETDVRYPHEERHRRRAQVMAMPYSSMGDFPARWKRGETVLMEMKEMGEELGRRFEAAAVQWSVSVPLIARDEWFGLFGIASLKPQPPDEYLIEVTEAGAAAALASFRADSLDPGAD